MTLPVFYLCYSLVIIVKEAFIVLLCVRYGGKSIEELGSVMLEKGITLSLLAPRRIPALVSMFEKAGGDLIQVEQCWCGDAQLP